MGRKAKVRVKGVLLLLAAPILAVVVGIAGFSICLAKGVQEALIAIVYGKSKRVNRR